MQVAVATPAAVPGFLGKVRDYARPRPTTGGDLAGPSPISAAIAGGIQGYITGGPTGAAAGLIGGYAGVKIGEKSGSFSVALGAGALVGAGVAAAATAGLAAMSGVMLPPQFLIGPAVMGAFTGAVGTLSGSRRAATRDSVYGGMLAGGLAFVATGNPAMVIAGAAGAGAAGRAVTPAGRAVLGVLTGAGAGAVAGLMGGNVAQGALVGAVLGSVGSLAGPSLRQVQRNATEDLTLAINKRLDPWLEKHPLTTRGKMIAGAASGALMLGPIGLVAGWKGAAVMAGIGATVGAVSTYKLVKRREQAQQAQEIRREYMLIAPAAYRFLPDPTAPQKD